MSAAPSWLIGREPWLAAAISVVLVVGVVSAAVTDPLPRPLTENRVRACALEAAAGLVAEPTVLRAVRLETVDDASWTATVSGNDSLLTLTYREADGVVTDATLADRGGGGALDAVTRARLLDDRCD